MRLSQLILLLLCASVSYAQPRWSPEVRAENEARWMRDSLKLPAAKVKKAGSISLIYNRQMDSVNSLQQGDKEKMKQDLMCKKDKDIKRLLTKPQYQKYYRRETLLRHADTVRYRGRQPY